LLPKNNIVNTPNTNQSTADSQTDTTVRLSKRTANEEDNNDSELSTKKKKKKTDNDDLDDEQTNGDTSQHVNPRFEWYDEIKLALGKATEQKLSLEKLTKKIVKRYNKLKPIQDKSSEDLSQKLEKKLRRAPFIEKCGANIYRLIE